MELTQDDFKDELIEIQKGIHKFADVLNQYYETRDYIDSCVKDGGKLYCKEKNMLDIFKIISKKIRELDECINVYSDDVLDDLQFEVDTTVYSLEKKQEGVERWAKK